MSKTQNSRESPIGSGVEYTKYTAKTTEVEQAAAEALTLCILTRTSVKSSIASLTSG